MKKGACSFYINRETLGSGREREMRDRFVEKLRNPSFILGFSSLAIMGIIVYFGNPPITEWFYWHYIPEMVGACLFGMWFSEIQFPFYIIAINVCIGIGLATLAFSLTIILLCMILVIPLFLGYWFRERLHTK